MGKYPPRRRNRLLVRRTILIGFALTVIWLGGLIAYANSIPNLPTNDDTRTDAIVVLTGGSGRLDEGLDLLERDMAKRLFVSGVYQGVDVKTLFQMFQHNPQELEARIGIGTAINTVENASETAEWMDSYGYTSMRLVTAAYHMPRSLLEFHDAMANIDIIAHPVFPERVKVERWWVWPGTMGLIASEYNKFMFAWLRHRGEKLLARKAAQS